MNNIIAQIKFSTFGRQDVLTDYMTEERALKLFDDLFESPKCYEAEMKTWQLNEDSGRYEDTNYIKTFKYGVINIHGEMFKVSVY